MFPHDRPSRNLPFPLKNPETSEESDDASGDMNRVSPDFFPIDPDERVRVEFEMSFNEFTTYASAIDIGRDIGYGEQSYLVWWTWLRSLIGLAMDCDGVADCIETSEAVQDALVNQINTNIDIQNAINKQVSQSLTNMGFDADSTVVATDVLSQEVKDLANCNKDALWAGIREGIVQRLDDNARQFYEIMVSKIDIVQRSTAIIGAIPVIGGVAEAVAEQFTEIIPDLLNAFESYSSIDALDTAACEIFGLVCSLCRYPTLQELYDYFANLGATGIQDIATLTTTVAVNILSGSAAGTGFIVWHTSIAVQLYVLLLNEKFGDLAGIDSITTMASLGEDFANDNWEVLCDECVAQYAVFEYDFATMGQGAWTITESGGVPLGVYEAGSMQGVVNGSTKALQIGFPLDASWRIIGARVEYEITNQTQTIMRYRPYAGSNTGAVNPSISNCVDTPVAGQRTSFQGAGIVPPLAPVTDKREFWLVLTAGTSTSTLKVHKVFFEFEFDFAPQDNTFATEDPEYLWCI